MVLLYRGCYSLRPSPFASLLQKSATARCIGTNIACTNSMSVSLKYQNRRAYQSNREKVFATASDNYYITTPIYYVNGLPNLGHAYTSVITDIIARYQSKTGRKVYFLSGTDEHGQKVQQSAEKVNKSSASAV